MIEKAPTPYPERTDDIIVLVCEPTAEYRKTIGYQGTTITNALKDYYSFITNREKVEVLKWIVAQPDFAELQRFSTVENKILTLYANQYNEILKKGETPNNLQIALKFVANGYDVFMLSNPKGTKSADFIIRKRNCLYYVEGKTSTGGSSLVHRFEKGAEQADRIVINLIGKRRGKSLLSEIKKAFEASKNLKVVYIFKASRLIFIKRNDALSKTFLQTLSKIWISKK